MDVDNRSSFSGWSNDEESKQRIIKSGKQSFHVSIKGKGNFDVSKNEKALKNALSEIEPSKLQKAKKISFSSKQIELHLEGGKKEQIGTTFTLPTNIILEAKKIETVAERKVKIASAYGTKSWLRKSCDESVFAQLHNPHRILNTSFEGNPMIKNAMAMKPVLESLLEDSLVQNDEKEMIKDALSMLNDRIGLNKQVQGIFSSSSKMHKHMLSELNAGKSVYLPSGWIEEDGGHAAIVKCWKDGDKLCYYIINKGDGIQNHPILEYTPNGKEKRDLRSVQYQMEWAEFEKSRGKNLCRSLYQLRQRPKNKETWQRGANELYGACLFYAQSTKENDPNLDFASTAQVSGNCTQASLNASLLDYFLSKGKSRENADRFMFLVRQKSLQHACQDWMKDIERYPARRLMLRDAAQQHLIRIDKLGEKDKECEEGRKLAYQILEDLDKIEKQLLKPEVVPTTKPGLERSGKALKKIESKGIELKSVDKDLFSSIIKLQGRPNTAQDAVKQLEYVVRLAEVEIQKGEDPSKLLIELTRILQSLPLSHEEEFWKDLSSSEASSILENLEKLTSQILDCAKKGMGKEGGKTSSFDKERVNEAMLIAYDVAIKMASCTYEMKKAGLDQYPISLPKGLKNLHQKELSREKKGWQIIENFKQRNKKISKDWYDSNLFDNPSLFSDEFVLNDKGGHRNFVRSLYGEKSYDRLKYLEFSEADRKKEEKSFERAEQSLIDRKSGYKPLLSLARRARGIKRSNLDLLSNTSFKTCECKFETREQIYPERKIEPPTISIFPKKEAEVSSSKSLSEEELYLLHPKKQGDFFENKMLGVVGRKKLKNVVEGLDNRMLGSLSLIETGDAIAPSQMLSWAKENAAYLSHPYVQKKILKILFSGNHLDEAIKNEEHTTALIHQFLKTAIKEYQQSESLETYLWVLELADLLNLRLQANQKEIVPTSSLFLGLMESSTLSMDQKRQVAIRYMARYTERMLLKGDYPVFLKAIFLFQAAPVNSAKIVEMRAQEAFLHYKKEAWNFFIQSENKNELANSILKLFEVDAKGEWKIEGNRLTSEGHALTFNGQLLEAGKQKALLPVHLQNTPLNREYFKKQGSKTYVQDSGYYVDDEAKVRLLPTKDNLDLEAIEKQIKLDGKPSWFRYQTAKNLESLLKQYPFWPPHLFKEPNQIYLEVNKSPPKMVILNEKGEICYRIERREGVSRVYEGENSSVEFVNLAALKGKNDRWKNWLQNIERSQDIALGLNEKGEVQKIDFPRLNLHFKQNEGGKLECVELKGFYLKKSQISSFSQYKGALVLENNKGETKTLIPCHPLKKEEKKENEEESSFAMRTDVSLNMDEVGQSLPGYFVFKGSGKETLQPETREGALYLSLLYRSEKKYTKAIEQLKKSDSPFGNTEGVLEIEEWLSRQPDLSPEGIAFDLQFSYQMKLHEEKWVGENVIRKERTEERERKISKLIGAHNQMISGKFEDVNQIPVELRLTNEQRKFLGGFQEEKVAIQRYSSSEQISGFSFLFQPNNDQKGHYQLLKGLFAASKGEKFKSLPPSFVSKEEKEKIEKIQDIGNKKLECGKLHLKLLMPITFPSIESGNIPPLEIDNFRPDKISGSDLAKNFNQIIDALSDNKTRDQAKRYLISCSRYFKEGDFHKPFFELLLLAANLPSELLAAIRKDTPTESFQALLENFLNESYDTYLDLDLSVWGWMHESNQVPNIKELTKEKAMQKQSIQFEAKDLKSEWIVQVKNKNYVKPFKDFIGLRLENMSKNVGLQQELAEKKLKNNCKEALKLANAVAEEMQIKRGGKQLKKLTLEDLTAAYLKQDGGLLIKNNPSLGPSQVKEIFKLLMEADLYEYQISQFGLIQEKLASNASVEEKQEFIQKIVDNQIEVDVWMKYPQLSLFAANTGMWPRQDQIEVIDWALQKLKSGGKLEAKEVEARMLQRGAGFGKTKVFTAIVAQIAANRGYLTTIFNVANLYDFGKKDLSESLRKAFMQNVELVEWNLGDKDKIKAEKLQILLGKLEKWKEEGRVVLLKPETWHLINLARKRGKLEKDQDLEKAAGDVLDLLEKGFAIMDEAHLILNPLTEVIQAVGEASAIPKAHMKQLVQNYKVLSGIEDLGLVTHQHVFASEEMIKKVQGLLIEDILKRDEFKECGTWLKSWLEMPMTTEPKDYPTELDQLSEKNPVLFDLIEMQRRSVQSLIPHALKQRGKIDYGKYPESKDGKGFNFDYAAPRHDTKETTSSFADEYITACLTCQMLAQEGLQFEAFKRFLDKLILQHQEQRKFEKGVTSIERKMREVLGKEGENFSLSGLALGEPTSTTYKLYELCKNHEGFQNYYLEQNIQPQIQRYKQSIASTPAELLSRFGVVICLTATPGSLETYPVEIQQKEEDNQLDVKSMENDLKQMLDKRNSQMVLIDPLSKNENGEFVAKNPKEVFSEVRQGLGEESGAFLNDVQFIIDGGGVFRNVESNEQVLDGFQANQQENQGKERSGVAVKIIEGERSAFFKEYGENEKITPLPGSELSFEMEKAKNDPKKLKDALHFISLQEATGTDWTFPDSCTGLFFIGEKMTLSNAIQAIKRDRKLANPNHKFAWVIPKAVAKSICGKDNTIPTQEQIINWLTENEEEAEKSKKQMRFVQGIDQVFEKHKPIKEGAEYEPVIAKEAELSPSQRYKQQKKLREYKDLLLGIIMEKVVQMYPKEDFQNIKKLTDLNTWFSQEEINKLQLLMNKASKLDLKEIQEGSFNKEQQVEQEKQKENVVEKQEEREVALLDPSFEIKDFAWENYPRLEDLEHYFENYEDIADYCKWPKNIKGPRLHGIKDAFLEIGKDKNRDPVKAIRPISGMLVMLKKGGGYEYFPLSETGMKVYSRNMRKERGISQNKFVLLSPSGDFLMEHAKHERRLNENERRMLLQDPSLEEAVALMALCQGKVQGSPECLKRIFGGMGNEDFDGLEVQIKAHLIGPGASFEESAFQRLKVLVKEPIQKEEVKKSSIEISKGEIGVKTQEEPLAGPKALKTKKFYEIEKELKKTEPLFIKRPSAIAEYFRNFGISLKHKWTDYWTSIKAVTRNLWPW